MSPYLFSRSLKLLGQHQFLVLLGMGMSLSSLFGTGWRLWLAQIYTLDFAKLTNIQSVEALLFSSELAQMQQLLLRGLLLAFGQFVLVWLVALMAEVGIVTAVSQQTTRPITFRHSIHWGWQHLSRFLAIDLLVFFPWFIVAMLLFAVMLILAWVLAGFATSQPSTGTVLVTTGLGLTCLFGLAVLLLPLGLASLWYRLLAFRVAVLHDLAARTAVRQAWHRIRQNVGDVFALVVILWGGQTLLLSLVNLATSPLHIWLTPLTNSDTISLQAAAWLGMIALTLLVWLVRGIVMAFTAIAWTLAVQNMSKEKN